MSKISRSSCAFLPVTAQGCLFILNLSSKDKWRDYGKFRISILMTQSPFPFYCELVIFYNERRESNTTKNSNSMNGPFAEVQVINSDSYNREILDLNATAIAFAKSTRSSSMDKRNLEQE